MIEREAIEAAPSRREFLTASAAAAAALATGIASPLRVHAAGDDRLKVGLIGCGGRGTGAASQALKADQNVALWAMGDAFADRIEASHKSLSEIEAITGKLDVPPERMFAGFDAYRQVIDSGVNVVLLATPPQFRPMHLRAAIEAGKHVFAEKPVAVDAPGVRSVLATCELAREKGLSVVSGLCLRYANGFQETIRRIHDGAIGQIHTLQANDYRGPIWVRPREADWTDMHWQMRNWYYFTWLSGDFNVEQHVHFLDVCSWAMGEYPERAVGMGGRQQRTGPEFGNIYDHHSVTYTYANGARLFANTRQMTDCHTDISARVAGEKGWADLAERGKTGLSITTGADRWAFDDKLNDFYQKEHDELFASIRAGKPINNGEYMSHSTLLAIMGRMATYTGQEITWEDALASMEDLSPPAYSWDAMLPAPVIAVPGRGV